PAHAAHGLESLGVKQRLSDGELIGVLKCTRGALSDLWRKVAPECFDKRLMVRLAADACLSRQCNPPGHGVIVGLEERLRVIVKEKVTQRLLIVGACLHIEYAEWLVFIEERPELGITSSALPFRLLQSVAQAQDHICNCLLA